ncbi:YitT family protein [Jeotgalibacillus sp. R-1-5s-1]|uniref:YczE/YyaS/YitT family protein n=1 Tax=Jeotgalibacillus sp. R-1-5s-1 TaxID=2555897 RepID=UPI00106CA419|nr:YitT family protein [Jeotgalibacillus sp. R-1-5s-1]TFD92858.1 YitT family protein [Jeotgalibacillus sp. R-1-5s-1]
MLRSLVFRWSFFLIGLVILALGATLSIKAQVLGIAPWDVLHVGLFYQLGLTIGTWAIIVGALIIAGTAMVLKQWPKIGAILNMLLVGVFIDIFNWLLPNPETMTGAIFLLLLGVVVMGYGVGIYVSANLGAGPRDTVMMIVHEKTGWKISTVRRGIELIVLAGGWFLGGPVGIGTVVIALFTGTIVNVSLPQSTILLNKLIERNSKAVHAS